ncbi:MFS transporter [Novosphingopyxis sp.]|uniref:MFS transporter n=1 Tax=Novosphingopyxis sp. TaxID=2709690 RepID=UPI003B5C04F1
MQASFHLLNKRRFLPLFATQNLGAFNDNLYKTAMVLFVVYGVFSDPETETLFSAVATGVFVLPFFLFSALSGQFADARDKAALIRIIKACEIAIMTVGALGLVLAWMGIAVHVAAIPLLLLALFAMGVHSTFFGPIKYAILPQHLRHEEVLGGTGLVEAGTYIAILIGTIVAGIIPVEVAAGAVILTALIGYVTGRQVPPAPPAPNDVGTIDYNLWTSSRDLVRLVRKTRAVWLAVVAISFFWTIGTVLFIQFPPLVKNVLTGDKTVASLFLAIFSVGIAIGSLAINRLLGGKVSARYSPVSVLAMGGFVVLFYFVCHGWEVSRTGRLYDIPAFMAHPDSWAVVVTLLGIAVAGGMFVVPLYAFLTTTVPKSETARAVAANNLVNSGAMVAGSLFTLGLSAAGIPITEQLLLSAGMCLVSAWLAHRLHMASRAMVLREADGPML